MEVAITGGSTAIVQPNQDLVYSDLTQGLTITAVLEDRRRVAGYAILEPGEKQSTITQIVEYVGQNSEKPTRLFLIGNLELWREEISNVSEGTYPMLATLASTLAGRLGLADRQVFEFDVWRWTGGGTTIEVFFAVSGSLVIGVSGGKGPTFLQTRW